MRDGSVGQFGWDVVVEVLPRSIGRHRGQPGLVRRPIRWIGRDHREGFVGVGAGRQIDARTEVDDSRYRDDLRKPHRGPAGDRMPDDDDGLRC